MRVLGRAYDAVLHAMAAIAAAALAWLMISVIVSVAMRNAGLQPFAWLFTSAEYSLLYMTMLGAPWLVRERGHVHIELVTAALKGGGGHSEAAGAALVPVRASCRALQPRCLPLGQKSS